MRKISPIKIYKSILDIVWYAAIVILSLWVIINIVSIGFDGVVRGGDIITLNIESKSINDNPFKFSDTFDFSLYKHSAMEIELKKFKVNEMGTSFILFYIVSALTMFSLTLFQLKLLRDFLSNIINKQIFITENVKKLTYIAFLELLTIPLLIGYYLIMGHIIESNQVLNPDFVFVTDYGNIFEPIIRALEYFVFASVFAFGLKLKEEQDLTI